MKKYIKALILVVCLVIVSLTISCTWSQENVSTGVGTENVITATITDPSGSVVPEAEVRVYLLNEAPERDSLVGCLKINSVHDLLVNDPIVDYTDSAGGVSITVTDSGRYFIAVEKQGLDPLGFWIESYVKGKAETMEIQLKPAYSTMMHFIEGDSATVELTGNPLVYTTGDSLPFIQILVPEGDYSVVFNYYTDSSTSQQYIVENAQFEMVDFFADTLTPSKVELYSLGCPPQSGLCDEKNIDGVKACIEQNLLYNWNEALCQDEVDAISQAKNQDVETEALSSLEDEDESLSSVTASLLSSSVTPPLSSSSDIVLSSDVVLSSDIELKCPAAQVEDCAGLLADSTHCVDSLNGYFDWDLEVCKYGKKGLTWGESSKDAILGTTWVGCGGGPGNMLPDDESCDAYTGDTECIDQLPILCIKREGLPRPAYDVPDKYSVWGWSEGTVVLSSPVIGYRLNSVQDAHDWCEAEFGLGYEMGEHHMGKYIEGMNAQTYTGQDWVDAVSHQQGEWAFVAYGDLSNTTRFWMFINDQPAHCWD
ncbi:MAG: carboxypeptidase-like regulatory domain-containing protein [Fibrobacterales bacterium]